MTREPKPKSSAKCEQCGQNSAHAHGLRANRAFLVGRIGKVEVAAPLEPRAPPSSWTANRTCHGLATIGYTPEQAQKAKAFWGRQGRRRRQDPREYHAHGAWPQSRRNARSGCASCARSFLAQSSARSSCPPAFSSAAVIRSLRGNTTERWGAWDYKVSQTESRIWGDNEMGHLLMRVRDEIRL